MSRDRGHVKTLATTIILTALLASTGAWRQAPSADETAVRATIDNYFKGYSTGDRSHWGKAFHPEAQWFSVNRDGTLSHRTVEGLLTGGSGTPPADEAQQKRTIVSVDITATAAVVKVRLDYPGGISFTDYMSLLKIGGDWRIVAKTFVREVK